MALVAFGVALAAAALRLSRRGRAVRTWTRMVGRVVESRVEEVPGDPEQGGSQWRLALRYAYEARGERRLSDQVWIGSRAIGPSQDRTEPQRWVDRFPAGAEVTVWVDPADPGEAVIVPEQPRAQVAALLAVGLLLAVAGSLLLARSGEW